MARKKAEEEVPVCIPMNLPEDMAVEAAAAAIIENPVNAPPAFMYLPITGLIGAEGVEHKPPTPMQLALATGSWWRSGGVDLTVGFLEQTTSAFRDLVLLHANSWGETANVRFRWTQTSPQVRITTSQRGYWSYRGTDLLQIAANRPTMNLEGFTERSFEKLWYIVVHEFGHTIGCDHEQLRAAIVKKILIQKAIAFYREYAGWDERTTRHNVLTPLEERSIMGSDTVDELSIMCYQLPASIMSDGRAVPGGKKLSVTDKAFIAKVYPKTITPTPPPPTPGAPAVLEAKDEKGKTIGKYVPEK